MESPGGGTAVFFAAYFGSAQALDVLMTGGADAGIAGANGLHPREVICLCADNVSPAAACSVSKCGRPEDTRQIATLLDQVCSSICCCLFLVHSIVSMQYIIDWHYTIDCQ